MEDFSTLEILSLSSGLFIIFSYLIDISKLNHNIVIKKSNNINIFPIASQEYKGFAIVKKF